mgnify:CR=1 FL=1
MKIVTKIDEFESVLELIKGSNKSVGLVLTMGNIHKGHISLVDKAILENDFTVVTIFINPTQFNHKDDYNLYPKTLDNDIEKLKSSNCDLLYLPEVDAIYPKGLIKEKTITKYRNILCDKYRPGHFDGVTTVVDRFFEIINPNRSYFGEKDFQQLKFVKELVKIKGHNINIISCSSIRDDTGMSFASRNSNFTKDQYNIFRKLSEIIHNFINSLINNKTNIDFESLRKNLNKINITKIDYLEIRTEKDLEITNNYKGARLFIALYIDQIRIIDNFKLYQGISH